MSFGIVHKLFQQVQPQVNPGIWQLNVHGWLGGEENWHSACVKWNKSYESFLLADGIFVVYDSLIEKKSNAI